LSKLSRLLEVAIDLAAKRVADLALLLVVAQGSFRNHQVLDLEDLLLFLGEESCLEQLEQLEEQAAGVSRER